MQPHVTADGAAAATIYALVCPDTARVRYVGQTLQDPARRLSQHIRKPSCGVTAEWLRGLVAEGKIPELRVLEQPSIPERMRRERFWICELRERGEPLLNQSRGGNGSRLKPAPLIVRMCENCGDAIWMHPSRLAGGKGRFCGKRCASLYRYRRGAKKCHQCGSRFTTGGEIRVRAGRKFCSWPCYLASKDIEQRFGANVEKSEGCWVWTGRCNPVSGAGMTTLDNHPIAAHRVSWQIHFGPVPPGLMVGRRCETRNCVQPKHLFIGTLADITAEKVRKGRQATGERTRPETRARGGRHGSR